MSPNATLYDNPRDQHFNMLINADEEYLRQIVHEDEEEAERVRNLQYSADNSPYRNLTYH